MADVNTLPKPGWLARILITLATLTLAILGFFFLTMALAVGAVVALVIGVRVWWLLRRLKRGQRVDDAFTPAASDHVVDGEYRVIKRESTATRLPASTESEAASKAHPESPAEPNPNNTPPAP